MMGAAAVGRPGVAVRGARAPANPIGDVMSHAVHYRAADGDPRFEQAGSLEQALAQVERLRNEEGVSDVRVYREVPIAFKTYYKATVAEDDAVTTVPPARPVEATTATPPPGAMPLTPPPATAPPAAKAHEEAPDGDGAKRGSLFSRS